MSWFVQSPSVLVDLVARLLSVSRHVGFGGGGVRTAFTAPAARRASSRSLLLFVEQKSFEPCPTVSVGVRGDLRTTAGGAVDRLWHRPVAVGGPHADEPDRDVAIHAAGSPQRCGARACRVCWVVVLRVWRACVRACVRASERALLCVMYSVFGCARGAAFVCLFSYYHARAASRRLERPARRAQLAPPAPHRTHGACRRCWVV
jgi:hypothetical protein